MGYACYTVVTPQSASILIIFLRARIQIMHTIDT